MDLRLNNNVHSTINTSHPIKNGLNYLQKKMIMIKEIYYKYFFLFLIVDIKSSKELKTEAIKS